jgi:hypothetical protein
VKHVLQMDTALGITCLFLFATSKKMHPKEKWELDPPIPLDE